MPSIETLTLRRALKKYASVDEIRRILREQPELANEKDEDDWKLLDFAVANRASPEVVELLLSLNPKSAQERTKDGVIPLHIACSNRASVGVVKLLLDAHKKGARERSRDGVLPLHYACATKASVEVVQALLDAFVDGVLERTSEGWLPLHYAVRYHAPVAVVRLLVETYKKGVRERDHFGMLPLHVATRWKAPVEVVQLLVQAYPEAVYAKDVLFVGSTPLDYAIDYNASPTVLLFLQSPPRTDTHHNKSPASLKDDRGAIDSIKHGALTTQAHALLSGFKLNGSLHWEQRAPMLEKRWGFAAVALDQYRMLVMGGYDENWVALKSVEEYDVRTDQWTRLPDLSKGRTVHCAAMCNQIVYVFGGQDEEANRLSSIEFLDLSADPPQWSTLPHHLSVCGEGGAAVTVGKLIYVMGGQDGSGTDLSTVEILDTESGFVRKGPSMVTRRSGCAAALVGNTIWVVGGFDPNWNALNTAESLSVDTTNENPSMGEWELFPATMSTKKVFPTVTAIGHCLVVTGGKDDNGFNLSVVEVLDTKRGIWWRVPDTIQPRWAGAAVLLENFRIMVMGGRSEGVTHSSLESLILAPTSASEMDERISEMESELHSITSCSNPFNRGKRKEKMQRIEDALTQLRQRRVDIADPD